MSFAPNPTPPGAQQPGGQPGGQQPAPAQSQPSADETARLALDAAGAALDELVGRESVGRFDDLPPGRPEDYGLHAIAGIGDGGLGDQIAAQAASAAHDLGIGAGAMREIVEQLAASHREAPFANLAELRDFAVELAGGHKIGPRIVDELLGRLSSHGSRDAAQARAEIEELKRDRAFTEKLFRGTPAERRLADARWQALHARAFKESER